MKVPNGYQTKWLELDGLVNFRDLAGLPAVLPGSSDKLEIQPKVLYRSDNLNTLNQESVEKMISDFGLTDVIDLRSDSERVVMGPTLLSENPLVNEHLLSLYKEGSDEGALPSEEKPTALPVDSTGTEQTDTEMPWGDGWQAHQPADEKAHIHFLSNYYVNYLQQRPENVLAAIKAIAYAQGASVVHCAAGKDRTGTILAIALSQAGVPREYIAADYQASSVKIPQILEKMSNQEAYREELKEYPSVDRQKTPGEAIYGLLENVEKRFGCVDNYLKQIGWTDADTAQLQSKLFGI